MRAFWCLLGLAFVIYVIAAISYHVAVAFLIITFTLWIVALVMRASRGGSRHGR